MFQKTKNKLFTFQYSVRLVADAEIRLAQVAKIVIKYINKY